MSILTQKTLKIVAILVLLLSIGTVVAFADDGEAEDDGDMPNTDFPCNPAVEAMLEAMVIVEGCDFFDTLDVSPGQFMKSWRLATMLEENPEDVAAIWQDLMNLKTDSGYGWGQIKMAYYLGESVVAATDLLETYRTGEEKVGWGNLKKAKALVESELYDGTLDKALTDLETMGWDELKPDDFTGPPPWSNGKGSDSDVDSTEQTNQGKPDNPGKGNKNSDNGPPYGKANGQNKEKPNKNNDDGGDT